MTNSERTTTILIIDDDESRAVHLREMIEFLDAPSVQVSDAQSWESIAATTALSAVFLGASLKGERADAITAKLAVDHPQTPVVCIQNDTDGQDRGRADEQ